VRLSAASVTMLLATMLYPRTAEAQRTWHPTITGNSPNVLQHGAAITITGSDLNPPGWQRRLTFRGKYYQTSSPRVLSHNGSTTQFVITADRDMRGDSVRIEWVAIDTLAAANPIPISERVRYLRTTFEVQAPPDLTFGGQVIAPDIGPSFRLMSLVNGRAVVKGRWLTRPTLRILSFDGIKYSAASTAYEPRGWTTRVDACCDNGADRVEFVPPTKKTSGWLLVDNSLGRDSAAVTFALPPAPTQVVQQTATGTAPLSPSNTVVRGRTYVIRGQHLSITHALSGTTSIKRGTPQLGSLAMTPVFASDTSIIFTVPGTFSAPSATLGVVTPLGSASLGTFSIASPSLPINVTGLSAPTKSGVQTTVLTPGTSVLMFAALDLPIGSKDHEWGSLIVTQTGGPAGAVRLPGRPIPVTGPSTEIKVGGGDVQTSTQVTITVAHESNGLNGQVTQTQQRSFTVRPPHPIKIEGNNTVTSGSTQVFTVRFDSATSTSSTMFTLLSSTNPNVAVVPVSATITGDRAVFTATMPPASQSGGTATLSASMDGATASLPVTVQLPQVQQLTLYDQTTVVTNALAAAVIRAEARFTGKVAPSGGLRITSGDTALVPFNSTLHTNGLSFDGLKYTQHFQVSPGLSQPRSVTVTGTSSPTSTGTANVSLTPIVISTFTATPNSGGAGSTITATALFSAATKTTMHVTYASADTTKATVSPATSLVSPGTTSKVVSILLKGPVTTPRQVPITVTLRVFGDYGTIVSTQTVVVTVNP
jgi:hypothetical protein